MASTGFDVASLLGVLSRSDEAAMCPLAGFARDIRSLAALQQEEDLGNVLAQRSTELVREEEKLNASRETLSVTYDKLRAEMTRVEAQMRTQERRINEVAQQKKLCKVALNLYLAGEVPNLVDLDTFALSPVAPSTPAMGKRGTEDAGADEGGEERPNKVAPEPAPMKNSPSSRPAKAVSSVESDSAGPLKNGVSTISPRPIPANLTHEGVLSLLKMPDINETMLLNAIEGYTQHQLASNSSWCTMASYRSVLAVMVAVLNHLSEPRPPVQLVELRLLGYALQSSPTTRQSGSTENLYTVVKTLVREANAVPVLTKLLRSVNDDVKCEALDCLVPLVCGTHVVAGTGPSRALTTFARKEFLAADGLEPLVNIVMMSTSEAVLERALIFLWCLLTKDDKTEAVGADKDTCVRSRVRELGGLHAVLDLLYTDSLTILENVSMVIGYITREDASKTELREIGGLEKITATLRHPSDSIKTKMAGAVWNCASKVENRKHLRELGAIPALLELLRSAGPSTSAATADRGPYEFMRENAAGALWNLSVEPDCKTQIIEYGGVQVLVEVMRTSSSTGVLENTSGTLWNCSASAEARPVIRIAGGIPVLLSFLERWKPLESVRTSSDVSDMRLSERIVDNVAGALRNCATNDQNKPVIRECGGVELLVGKLKGAYLVSSTAGANGAATLISPSTVDKLASMLWILSGSPEIKHTIRISGGIEAFVSILEKSSHCIAGSANTSSKSPSLLAPVRMPTVIGKKALEAFRAAYGASTIRKLPFSAPSLSVPMNVKEKLIGILRNCSTIAENRPMLIAAGAIRCLVAVVLDCFTPDTVFQAKSVAHKSSRLEEPSLQLKENVAAVLWYLSRDDKDSPRVQGGLELMCMMLLSPQQPDVVLDQIAGALSSLTVNNSENRDAIRSHGGLLALVQLVTDKARAEYPQNNVGNSRSGHSDAPPHVLVVLNALLTLRNCTVSNSENVRICCDAIGDSQSSFGGALLHIIRQGSEDCAKESALIIKNMCTVSTAAEYFVQNSGVELATSLSERASSDSVRRAATSLLQILKKAVKRGSPIMHIMER